MNSIKDKLSVNMWLNLGLVETTWLRRADAASGEINFDAPLSVKRTPNVSLAIIQTLLTRRELLIAKDSANSEFIILTNKYKVFSSYCQVISREYPRL